MFYDILLGLAFLAVFVLGLFIGRANPKKVGALGAKSKDTIEKISDAIKDKLDKSS